MIANILFNMWLLILNYLDFQQTDWNWYNFLELLELSIVEKIFHVKQHSSNNMQPFVGSQPSKNCHAPNICFASKVEPLTLRISECLGKSLFIIQRSNPIQSFRMMKDIVPKHCLLYKTIRPALFEGCWRRLISCMKSTWTSSATCDWSFYHPVV